MLHARIDIPCHPYILLKLDSLWDGRVEVNIGISFKGDFGGCGPAT